MSKNASRPKRREPQWLALILNAVDRERREDVIELLRSGEVTFTRLVSTSGLSPAQVRALLRRLMKERREGPKPRWLTAAFWR